MKLFELFTIHLPYPHRHLLKCVVECPEKKTETFRILPRFYLADEMCVREGLSLQHIITTRLTPAIRKNEAYKNTLELKTEKS